MSMQDTIGMLRAAIAMSKRPGNEGQCLHNGKAYRPVAEVLTPSLAALEALETMVRDLESLEGLTPQTRGAILNITETFKASFEPNLTHLNAAKAALKRG